MHSRLIRFPKAKYELGDLNGEAISIQRKIYKSESISHKGIAGRPTQWALNLTELKTFKAGVRVRVQ